MPKLALTEKRLAANRANALKSTGPRTAEGKRRSSQNRRTHGLFSNNPFTPEEQAIARQNGQIAADDAPHPAVRLAAFQQGVLYSYFTFYDRRFMNFLSRCGAASPAERRRLIEGPEYAALLRFETRLCTASRKADRGFLAIARALLLTPRQLTIRTHSTPAPRTQPGQTTGEFSASAPATPLASSPATMEGTS